MKTPATALALLLSAAPTWAADAGETVTMADGSEQLQEVVVTAQRIQPSGSDKIIFNGREYDRYVDPDSGAMGPLIPGQEWRQEGSAFNTASVLANSRAGEPGAEGGTSNERRNPGAGSVNSIGPGTETVVTTSRGQMICDNYDCRPVTPADRAAEEARVAAAKAEAERQARAGGYCPSGNCGSTSDRPADQPNDRPAALAGNRGDRREETPADDVSDLFLSDDTFFAGLGNDGNMVASAGPGETGAARRQEPRGIKVDLDSIDLGGYQTPAVDSKIYDSNSLFNTLGAGFHDPGESPALQQQRQCDTGAVCAGTNDLR